MKLCSAIVAGILTLGTATPSPAADFSWAPMENVPDVAEIIMVGNIVEGDADRLTDAIQSANRSGSLVLSVSLYSRGGSLGEGIEIGRILRQNRLSAKGPMDSSAENRTIRLCSMTAGSYTNGPTD